MGGSRVFTAEEITAMLFTKLKETGEEALKTKVKDVVLSCPSYFTDKERRALLDAAAIAGTQIFYLINLVF
jgi:heat shock protein